MVMVMVVVVVVEVVMMMAAPFAPMGPKLSWWEPSESRTEFCATPYASSPPTRCSDCSHDLACPAAPEIRRSDVNDRVETLDFASPAGAGATGDTTPVRQLFDRTDSKMQSPPQVV